MSALAAELHLPRDVIVRGGASQEVGDFATSLGLSRVLLVTDAFFVEQGIAGAVADRLTAAGIVPRVFAEVQPDPTTANVEAGLAALREHAADGVVALGGGSPLDTGKAVAVMATNEGAIADFAGYHQIPRPGLPLIAIPTTAGTGSEVTRVTVITDAERGRKLMILDDHLLARVALADFELTRSCPAELTAHVGVDSLTHAIEAYVSSKANPITDGLALQAAELLQGNLRRAYHDGSDDEAREAMMLGATLAGAAFSNASVALVHGMSRPIGAHFHVPHGLSNAVLLPTVTRFSLGGAVARYATLARRMDLPGATGEADDAVAAQALVEELDALNAELGIPSLSGLGVERDHFDRVKAEMAQAALDSGSPGFNPREPSAEEIVGLYDAIY
jgi:alcohol dehydrogenase class IV